MHRFGPRPSLNWPNAAGLAAGVALDALLGDPRRGHPVALSGRAAQAAEARLYTDDWLRGPAARSGVHGRLRPRRGPPGSAR